MSFRTKNTFQLALARLAPGSRLLVYVFAIEPNLRFSLEIFDEIFEGLENRKIEHSCSIRTLCLQTRKSVERRRVKSRAK